MKMSRQQNVVHNEKIVTGNYIPKKMKMFKYMGIPVTNTQDIHE